MACKYTHLNTNSDHKQGQSMLTLLIKNEMIYEIFFQKINTRREMKSINLVVESDSTKRMQNAIGDAVAIIMITIFACGFTALLYNLLFLAGVGVLALCGVTILGFCTVWFCQACLKKQYVDLIIVRPFRRDFATFIIPVIALLVGTLPFSGFISSASNISPLLAVLYPLTFLFFCFGGSVCVAVKFVIRISRVLDKLEKM